MPCNYTVPADGMAEDCWNYKRAEGHCCARPVSRSHFLDMLAASVKGMVPLNPQIKFWEVWFVRIWICLSVLQEDADTTCVFCTDVGLAAVYLKVALAHSICRDALASSFTPTPSIVKLKAK